MRSCLPAQWGRDRETTLAALRRGFGELGLDEVSIALLHTFNNLSIEVS
jgi:hypothetical protein